MADKTLDKYLQDLILQRNDLADNLAAMGVDASQDEKFNTLVPKVLEIKTGGGGAGSGELKVTYDYIDTETGEQRTEVRYYNQGDDADLPNVGDVAANKENPALTFQGWTHVLDDVQGEMHVGAKYITADGKTYFLIRITKTTGSSEADALTQTIYLNRTVAGTLSLDWGDGSAVEEIINTGNLNRSHTYSQTGDYWVTAWISEGSGAFTFGNGSSSTTVFGGSVQEKRNILRRVFIGNDVTSIGNYAFQNCYSLTSITIPDGVTSIGNSVFSSCYSLTSITIPYGVTNTGTFESCYSLTSIIIPDSVTSISAFTNCYSLTSIIIPDRVTRIPQSAFSGCHRLTSITIPSNVTNISNYAFRYCHGLTSIIIPEGIKGIDIVTFESCYSLTSIIIPDSVTSIGNQVFQNCYSLTNMSIPYGITIIGSSAFSGCRRLTEYTFNSTTPPTLVNTNAFTGINSITKMYVPDESVNAYKTATNWTTYANYIYPMSEKEAE